MEYGFQRHEPCFGMVLFVLTLDKKKMKERMTEAGQVHPSFCTWT